jgi:hypothetical protein
MHTCLYVLHRLPAASVPGRRRGQRHAHLPLLLLHCLVMDAVHCWQRHQGQLHQWQRQHQDVRHHDSVPKRGGHGDDSVCFCGQQWATSAAWAEATTSPTATGESFACAFFALHKSHCAFQGRRWCTARKRRGYSVSHMILRVVWTTACGPGRHNFPHTAGLELIC